MDYTNLPDTSFVEQKKSFSKPFIVSIIILILILIGFYSYRSIVLREVISEFSLQAKIYDKVGIDPTSSFLLKSSNPLNATVIKNNIVFNPEIDFDVKKIEENEEFSIFEIIPQKTLKDNQIYSISIKEGGIAERDFGWAFQVKAPFQVISTSPRDEGKNVPVKSGIEIRFNREDLKNIEKAVHISPEVRGSFRIEGDKVIFVPKESMKTETVYTVSINKDIEVSGSDDEIMEDYTFQFETEADQAPSSSRSKTISLNQDFLEFSPTSPRTVMFSKRNFSNGSLDIKVHKFNSAKDFSNEYVNSYSRDLDWTYYNQTKPFSFLGKKISFEGSVQIENVGDSYSHLFRLPSDLDSGFYIAEISSPSLTDKKQVWFQITPLVGWSAYSNKESLVWIKKDSGEVVTDASVYSGDRLLGKTDNQGILIFDTLESLIRTDTEYVRAPRETLVVSKGGDNLVVLIGDKYGYASKVSEPDEWWDYLSFDKTEYKRNDTLRFWGILKPRDKASAEKSKVTVELSSRYWQWSDEDKKIFASKEVEISPYNSIEGELVFENVKPGIYELVVTQDDKVVGTKSVTISDEVKPAYSISVDVDKKAVFAGEEVIVRVKAEFFDGTPVSGLDLNYGVAGEGTKKKIRLDQEGQGSFVVNTSYKDNSYYPTYESIWVRPELSEEGEIYSDTNFFVLGPSIVLTREDDVREGDNIHTFKLSAREVNPSLYKESGGWWIKGAFLEGYVKGQNVDVKVEEIQQIKEETGTNYDYINRVSYKTYKYRTEYLPVKDDSIKTDASGIATYSFAPADGKYYKLVFTTKDSSGRKSAITNYAYGSHFGYGFFNADHGNFSIKFANPSLGDEAVSVGENIDLSLEGTNGERLPDDIGSQFIVIKVNNGSISYISSSKSNLFDTFTIDDIPNVQYVGAWFDGKRFFDTDYAYKMVRYNSEEKRLNISFKTDKESYKPSEEISIDVEVRGKDGRPEEAEVNIFALDSASFALNPAESDIVNELYRSVYSSILTRSTHTASYLGGGGAERGGGGGDSPRADFKDVAFFKTVRTNKNGKVNVKFKLPDNLTSWRISTQAITKDLKAGKRIDFATVKLPFFVTPVINEVYLEADKPVLKLRVYGQESGRGESDFYVKSDTLFEGKLTGKGLRTANIYIPKLSLGKHSIVAGAKYGDNEDALQKEINVIKSYFKVFSAETFPLDGEVVLPDSEGEDVEVLITSPEKSLLYSLLKRVSYSGGLRLDQSVSGYVARNILNEEFGEKNAINRPNIQNYEANDGGLSLFSYSSSELYPTAVFAVATRDMNVGFADDSLREYFKKSLEDEKSDLERVSLSLLGLSALQEPVLSKVKRVMEEKGLSLKDKVHLSLALSLLGDKETARNYFVKEIRPEIVDKGEQAYLEMKDKDSEILETTLLASLAFRTSLPEAPKLSNYAISNYPTKTLSNLELLTLVEPIKQSAGFTTESSFRYSLNDKVKDFKVSGKEIFKKHFSSKEAKTFKVISSKGNLVLTVGYPKSKDRKDIKTDSSISISRSYSVDNTWTEKFKDGDIVTVTLYPRWGDRSLDGGYEITDHLPSGLKVITKIQDYDYGNYYQRAYPIEVDGQRVRFYVEKGIFRNIYYYARVTSPGTYTADSAYIQSARSNTSINLSEPSVVTIE